MARGEEREGETKGRKKTEMPTKEIYSPWCSGT